MNELKGMTERVGPPEPSVAEEGRQRLLAAARVARAASPSQRRPSRIGARRIGARWLGIAVPVGAVVTAVVVSQLGPGTPVVRTASASEVLDRAAAAAEAERAPEPRADQYILQEVRGTTSAYEDGKIWGELFERRDWYSVDGSRAGFTRSEILQLIPRSGQQVTAEDRERLGVSRWFTCPPGLASSYQDMRTWPTDPAALRVFLGTGESHTPSSTPRAPATSSSPSADRPPVQITQVGDILRSGPVPPRLRAALYRLAAKAPGVRLVPDAVDAAGRHGIAVSWESAPVRGERFRTLLIFDPKTYRYLGESWESARGTAWTPVDSTALINQKVVDRLPAESRNPDLKNDRCAPRN